jgi:hypothetical protein
MARIVTQNGKAPPTPKQKKSGHAGRLPERSDAVSGKEGKSPETPPKTGKRKPDK